MIAVALVLFGYLVAALIHAGKPHLRHRYAGALFLAACAALTLGVLI